MTVVHKREAPSSIDVGTEVLRACTEATGH
jgi:hypothetical protein